MLKTLLFKIFWWIYATRFAKLIQFWPEPKCRRPRTIWRKNLVFHWRKIWYFVFIYFFPLVFFLFLVSDSVTWKLKLVSNILWMIVAASSIQCLHSNCECFLKVTLCIYFCFTWNSKEDLPLQQSSSRPYEQVLFQVQAYISIK